MSDPLEILLSAKAKDVRRQEIDELSAGSIHRRYRILRALKPVRSVTVGERLTAIFNEWRFVSGSAIGAAAMGIFAVTLFPSLGTNTRALTSAESEYAEALGNAIGTQPNEKSATSASRKSISTYEELLPNSLQIDHQAEASLTDASGGVPRIVKITSGDPLTVMTFDLRALTDLQQRILSVEYSSGTGLGSIVVTSTEALGQYTQKRYGVDLGNQARQQNEDVQVSFQYAKK